MNLSEMKQILADREIRLTRSLGQNFMHDANQLRRMVEAAALDAQDRVLEIGPGLGPLTELLLEKATEILAVETDRRMVEILRQRFAGAQNLTLLEADALGIVKDRNRNWAEWKMVSNLPYSVASPILVEMALHPAGPKRMVATLQAEVAQRLCAEPGGKDYGLLTLLVQLSYRPAQAFGIPASCFFPAPKVDSTCLVLERRTTPLLEPDLTLPFMRIVKRGFSQRRKMLVKLLKTEWPEDRIRAAFAALGLSLQIRAERVSLEQWIALTRMFKS